jgi:hypothetical protein
VPKGTVPVLVLYRFGWASGAHSGSVATAAALREGTRLNCSLKSKAAPETGLSFFGFIYFFFFLVLLIFCSIIFLPPLSYAPAFSLLLCAFFNRIESS